MFMFMFMFMFIDTIHEVGFRASRQLTMVKIHNFTLHITIGHTIQNAVDIFMYVEDNVQFFMYESWFYTSNFGKILGFRIKL